MALNPYFINGTTAEQRLIQDLVNEQLRMYGQEIVYMPRKFITEKKIIKELLVSKFDDSFHLEAYIATPDGFGGQGDILSKFGVRSTDEVTFIISRERYQDFISPFIVEETNIKLTTRPQEGDLIYFPLDNGLFEIKYVTSKRPFYQLNNLYVYELKCELFEYEDEIIDTGLDLVDNTVKNFGYMMTLNMVDANAFNATASIGLASSHGKSVSYIDVINGGIGYKTIPEVKIDLPDDRVNGIRATAVAILTTRNLENYIDRILIINPGAGYSSIPKVIVNSTTGSGFIGTCILSEGSLSPINIIDSGSGYSIPPLVSISTSPSGDNATAEALINSSGQISSIRYINAGSGYTTAPTITIEPSVGVSTGNYIYNEVIRGVSTGTSAYVKDWNFDTRTLKVSIINGNFALGESIVGAGATYKLYSIENYDLYDPYASNEEIEEEADQILDFSESNPFGDF
ncbi:MAG: hypothetical protein ABFC34_00555 [Methanobacterium sp.]